MISDTEDVKKNLTAAVLKETEIFKAKKEESQEGKIMHVMIKSKIEMLNSLLNQTGKSKIFDFRFHDLETVKLFNKKNKVYAELDCEKFFEMYDQFADLYQSNRTPDEILAEFNCFLYSSRYVWKPLRSGVGSSLLQTAVFNTLHETAHLEKLSETSILLNTCAAIRKNFGVFVAPENFMTAASLQKKATNIVGVYRSIGSLDVLDALAQNCFISPSLVDIGLDYCPKEILERIDRLRQLIESWIIAVREDIVSTDQGKLLFSEIDR
uniref:Uncharacterized protein n=1 Tax=Panagrolaimus davidi TaxID=227884 RepID=A0A914P5X1_9BILA